MTIASAIRAAAETVVPELTPAQCMRASYVFEALSGAFRSLGRGDERSMDELDEGIEEACRLIEDLPGPDRFMQGRIADGVKGKVHQKRDKIHE